MIQEVVKIGVKWGNVAIAGIKKELERVKHKGRQYQFIYNLAMSVLLEEIEKQMEESKEGAGFVETRSSEEVRKTFEQRVRVDTGPESDVSSSNKLEKGYDQKIVSNDGAERQKEVEKPSGYKESHSEATIKASSEVMKEEDKAIKETVATNNEAEREKEVEKPSGYSESHSKASINASSEAMNEEVKATKEKVASNDGALREKEVEELKTDNGYRIESNVQVNPGLAKEKTCTEAKGNVETSQIDISKDKSQVGTGEMKEVRGVLKELDVTSNSHFNKLNAGSVLAFKADEEEEKAYEQRSEGCVEDENISFCRRSAYDRQRISEEFESKQRTTEVRKTGGVSKSHSKRKELHWFTAPGSLRYKKQWEVAITDKGIQQRCPLCNLVTSDPDNPGYRAPKLYLSIKEHILKAHDYFCPIELKKEFGKGTCRECGNLLTRDHFSKHGQAECSSWVRYYFHLTSNPGLQSAQLQYLVKEDQRKKLLEVIAKYGNAEMKEKYAELEKVEDICAPHPLLDRSIKEFPLEECESVNLHHLDTLFKDPTKLKEVEEGRKCDRDQWISQCANYYEGMPVSLKEVCCSSSSIPIGVAYYVVRLKSQPVKFREVANLGSLAGIEPWKFNTLKESYKLIPERLHNMDAHRRFIEAYDTRREVMSYDKRWNKAQEAFQNINMVNPHEEVESKKRKFSTSDRKSKRSKI